MQPANNRSDQAPSWSTAMPLAEHRRTRSIWHQHKANARPPAGVVLRQHRACQQRSRADRRR
eukprot:4805676-Lingulodinium_polyedra.AAC.1